MGKTTAQNIRLGIFVITGTILLVIAAYLIGNRQNMFGDTFQLKAVFKNVNGLQNGNNVRFSGINVGTVNRIEMINDTTIMVYMIIEEKMRDHIKKDAIATIGSDGLVGSMLVNVVPGEGDAVLVEPGDQLKSYSKIETQDMLSTLNTTNENAALLTADLLEVTQSLTDGRGTLGRLLNDEAMAKDLKQTISNLKYSSQEATSALSKLSEIIENTNFNESAAGVLLTDSISGQHMRSIIVNLEQSSGKLDKLIKNLDSLVVNVKDGQGAVHYLTQDSLLVVQLENTMKNIESGVEKFNENMEALQHNFLTRGYFKKQERQKRKEAKRNE